MKAQITFEFMFWLLVGVVFLLTFVTITYHVYEKYEYYNSSEILSNLSHTLNYSITPYSEFGIKIEGESNGN